MHHISSGATSKGMWQHGASTIERGGTHEVGRRRRENGQRSTQAENAGTTRKDVGCLLLSQQQQYKAGYLGRVVAVFALHGTARRGAPRDGSACQGYNGLWATQRMARKPYNAAWMQAMVATTAIGALVYVVTIVGAAFIALGQSGSQEYCIESLNAVLTRSESLNAVLTRKFREIVVVIL